MKKWVLPFAALALALMAGCATGLPVPSALSSVPAPVTPPDPQPTASATPVASPLPLGEGEDELGREPHKGFSYLKKMIPDIVVELRYATDNNFTGAVVDGYFNAKAAMLTTQAAKALARVQEALQEKGLGLKVFDAYRPQKAVDCFVAWLDTEDDTASKEAFYPNEQKSQLFSRGYLAHRSGHSRGSTVDLTLIQLENSQELDMGTAYDFLDVSSHYSAKGLTKEQRENRKTLRDAMVAQGFVPYDKEWWHFTLGAEPFPDTYFDFDLK